MAGFRQPLRLSVQTKVLLVVLAVLVALPVATLWIVNRHIEKQMLDESRQSLATAEAVFLESLQIRTRTLVSRFRNAVREPRLKAQMSTTDPKTLSEYLKSSLLTEFDQDNEVILIVDDQAALIAGTRRDDTISLTAFQAAIEPIARAALDENIGTGTIAIEGRVYNVVANAVRLSDDDPAVGALVVGIRIGDAAVRELKSQTHAEVVIVADGHPAAATLPIEGLHVLWRPPASPSAIDGETPETSNVQVELHGEHYLASYGAYDSHEPHRGFRYILLSSYERRLRELEATRSTLVELSILGILVSAIAVGVLVRRIIRPLRALRDSAEAVGRGDFSQRIARFSNDECGDLALAFNHMTSNLQSSRAELEKTVETLKTTQAQLIQSEKLSAVGQFVAGVAHELNNPLTAVIGFSEILVQDEKNETARRHLDLIAKSAHRCHKIVQSLLAFSRQHAPERRLIELTAVIEDVLEIMTYDLRTSGITIERQFASALPPLMGDSHQLQQVFVNILGNARQALKATRSDGRIIVRTGVVDGWIRVDLQDNGPGIPPENLAKIFDPFFTTKPVGEGTGLGLSLVYGIVQEHGGKIRVESDFGHGATFVIELPASPPAALSGQPDEPAVRRRGLLTGKTVLVIDDEPWILELVRELVQREGCTVETTTHGERALELMAERSYDIIISDWKMPGLNGIRIYERAAARDPDVARRMLFMTGDVVSESFQDFLKRHQRACLSKPFSTEDFHQAVSRILEA